MGCARDQPEDERKQLENEEDRRATSAPRRPTLQKKQDLTNQQENEQRRMNKMKQERE